MIPITEIENSLVEVSDTESFREQRWRRTMTGKVQLRCPYCDRWFSLGKEFTVDNDGLVSDVVYHACDSEEDDEQREAGWVVRPLLVGWSR